MPLFSSSSDDQTRYSNALAYLQNHVDATLASLVRSRSNATADGKLISLGMTHGKMAGLSPDERNAVRALLLCHLALDPSPGIRSETQIHRIRDHFTTQKARLPEAIRSFIVVHAAGANTVSTVAQARFAAETPNSLTWRGNSKVDQSTCWNFVASCMFQAGIISLQKCLRDFYSGQDNRTIATRVLMHNTTATTTNYNGIVAGHTVGFYRKVGPSIVGMTHIAIATGNGECIGVRQPGTTGGVATVNIANSLNSFPISDRTKESVLICTCDPAGMENR